MTHHSTVTEAVLSRRSIRAFRPEPVNPAMLREVLEIAKWAPSGGNLQPWRLRVATGKTLKKITEAVTAKAAEAPAGEVHEYEIYPRPLSSPYRDRRAAVGEALYSSIGVARGDAAGRAAQFLANYQAFGAPCVIFAYVQRDHGAAQWSDMGMLLQTLMLLLRERGLDSCPQESWSRYAETVGRIIHANETEMLFAGLSVGYRDADAAINQFVPERAPLEEIVSFHD